MPFSRIDSKQNPRIITTAKLLDKKARAKTGLFLIEGWRMVKTALEADAPIEEIYATRETLERPGAGAMVASLVASNVAIFEVADEVLARLSDTVTPQGIVAVARRVERKFEDLRLPRHPLVMVADGVSDPGNLGSLARIAGAARADALVLLPGCVDWTSPKVLRASMGSVFQAPLIWAPEDTVFDFVERHKLVLAATSGTMVDERAVAIYDADLRGGIAMVFGNEAGGVSERIMQRADLLLTIPMPGPAESLNVTAAAAIAVFEALRQRR